MSEAYPHHQDGDDDHPDDVHVYPTYGRPHECSHSCWCSPEVDYVAESGAQVWVHRDMN